MPNPYWPLFDLRVRTPNLELRPAWDDGLVALAEVAAAGVHDPDFMPFAHPWTDQPPGEIERGTFQFHWRQRGAWTAAQWALAFIVLRDGEVVGTQEMAAVDFAKSLTISTGSWLGRRFHGQGIGKEMRAAVLHFAFAGLGAQRAESGAFHDNAASLGVSRALGYRENGDEIKPRRDGSDRLIRLVLSRADWETKRLPIAVTIENFDACRPMFGLS